MYGMCSQGISPTCTPTRSSQNEPCLPLSSQCLTSVLRLHPFLSSAAVAYTKYLCTGFVYVVNMIGLKSYLQLQRSIHLVGSSVRATVGRAEYFCPGCRNDLSQLLTVIRSGSTDVTAGDFLLVIHGNCVSCLVLFYKIC